MQGTCQNVQKITARIEKFNILVNPGVHETLNRRLVKVPECHTITYNILITNL